MRIENDIKIDFDSVLTVPRRSSLNSRKDVVLEREFKFKWSSLTWKGIGIVAANMDSVGTFEMAKSLTKFKCLTALNKHYLFGIIS